jgi:hypothetical protein
MVFMCVVLMVTFVVGYSLQTWIEGLQGRGKAEDPIVVTWAKGAVRETDLDYMRGRHGVAVRFMNGVIAKAIDAGGSPVVGGQVLSKQTGVATIGFPVDDSDEALIQTMLLDEEGRRMGIAVDLHAVKQFLTEVSSPELNEGDWKEIAEQAIGEGNSLSITDLFNQLAYELRAQHVRVLTQRGLLSVPPGELWEFFNRLKRTFSIEAYPVEVQPFVAKVTAEPTAAEIQALFEKGQSRDPNPAVAEPGFHQPLRAAFDYVKVDFKSFLENAKKQVTEEQIAEKYKKNIEQGLHKVIELPPDPTKPAEKPGEGEKPAEGDKPADGEKKDEKPAEVEKKEGDAPAKPEEKPAESKPAEEKPAEEKPADAKPAKEGDSGGCQDQPADKPAEEKPAEKPAEEEKPADPAKPAEENPADPAKPAEEKPADEKPADPAKPAEEKPADPADPAKPAEPAKEVKYKPLEEVREEILTELAQPIAQEAQTAAVKALVDEITAFGKLYRRWQGVKDQPNKPATFKDPGELNLKDLAAKYGFTAGSTPLIDRYTARDYEIGQKVSIFNFQLMQMGQSPILSFADVAFGDNVPLYDPQQADSSEPDVSYIFFRTQVVPEKDVKLADVREQVIAAWKKNKAFELAKEEAQALADKAQGVKSLQEVLPEGAKVLTPAPFTWMTTGSLAFGFGQPSLSAVDGIENVGDDFMRGVFSLSPGEAGIAPNAPHTRVYVVRVIAQSPTDDLLREQFLESGLDGMSIANREVFEVFVQWFDDLEKRMAVKWARPPQPGSRA